MGLFDFFTQEGKLKRHVRRMGDQDSQPEDRDASARWLAEEGSPKAVYGLLTRFDWSMSNHMKDRAEKETIFGLLRDLGAEKVGQPLRAYFKKARHYAWPLRLLTELEGEGATVAVIFELLAGDVGKATFEPERRKELLIWLSERKHPEMVANVRPFLKDFDEEVRYAAAEVLLAQGDEAREPLLEVLLDPKEESLRLKHRIANVFQQRRWPVGQDVAGALPEGFTVHDGRIVAV